MNIKLQLPDVTELKPRLTVIGVGGAGGNAVNNMIASGLAGVNFIVANTDAQALAASSAEQRIQLGVSLTEGLGAGSKPEIGSAAAEEALEDIRTKISGSHMVFVAAGMGGGTGTGAASVIARVAKELDILVVGVVTKPFQFEGQRRMRIADAGIAELRKYVDTLIVIPNQNLFRVANEKTTFAEAFVLADQVLYSGIACIVDLIVKEGLINLDFADVRTIMSGMGTAMMGTGEASGERRAVTAAEEAIANPLLDDVSLRGAKGLLLSIIGGRDLTLYDVDEAASRVRQEVDPEANIIVGATFDESLGNRVRVSIVASGLSETAEAMRAPPNAAPKGYQQQTTPPPLNVPQAQQHAGHGGPPPQPRQSAPARSHPQGTPGDFMDVLSRAMDDGSTTVPPPHGKRDAWMGPENVVIEERPPQLGPAPMPAPKKADPASAGRPPQSFTPAGPTEIRRGPRRMPTVEDFPPIAQREFRSRAGEHESGGQHMHAANRHPPEQPQTAKKPSLFERITGFRRRSESPNHPPAEESSYDASFDGSGNAQNDPHYAHRRHYEDLRTNRGVPSEPVDFTDFSRKGRGRQ
jgi:cell division protein FtsZ